MKQVTLNTNYYLKKSLNPGAGWPAPPNVQLTLTNALSGAEINNRKFNSENEDYNNYGLKHPITISLFIFHYSIFWAKHSEMFCADFFRFVFIWTPLFQSTVASIKVITNLIVVPLLDSFSYIVNIFFTNSFTFKLFLKWYWKYLVIDGLVSKLNYYGVLNVGEYKSCNKFTRSWYPANKMYTKDHISGCAH